MFRRSTSSVVNVRESPSDGKAWGRNQQRSKGGEDVTQLQGIRKVCHLYHGSELGDRGEGDQGNGTLPPRLGSLKISRQNIRGHLLFAEIIILEELRFFPKAHNV